MGAVAWLSLVDNVRHRIETGQRVNWLLRISFQSNFISLMFCVVSAITITLVIVLVLIG